MAAVVLAAGTGARFGGHKQFLPLGGARLVDRAVASASAACDAVVLVLPAGVAWDGEAVTAVVGGGATRSASVRAGLAAVPSSAEVVVVQDAAHPLARPELTRSVVAAVVDGADGAVPVLPVNESLGRIDGGALAVGIAREGLVLVQTPHAFRADVLRRAHVGDPEAADDSVLVQRAGGRLVTVAGDPANLHVTTPAELEVARRIS